MHEHGNNTPKGNANMNAQMCGDRTRIITKCAYNTGSDRHGYQYFEKEFLLA